MTEIQNLAEIVQGTLQGPKNVPVEHLILDSRRSRIAANSVFFAIRGTSHDGHQHIQELVDKGVKLFVLETPVDIQADDLSVVYVQNTTKALQDLAAWHRQKFAIPVVGITGSNGKTIVKEWAYQLLHRFKSVVRSPRSYNSQVGVPLSVWNLNTEHELAIFEAGISVPGEMQKLEAIIKPTIGIFTNIGDAHSSGFNSVEQKIEEKLKLFVGCEHLIYHKDDGPLSIAIEQFALNHSSVQLIAWTKDFDKSAFLTVKEISTTQSSTLLELVFKAKKYTVDMPFTDEASLENCMHVLCLGLHLGLDPMELFQSIKYLHPIEMRLNQKRGTNGCQLISDFYNSDLRSLELALDWMSVQHKSSRKTVILSDIQQSALKGRELYSNVNRLLKTYGIDRMIGIGPDINKYREYIEIPIQSYFNNTEEFMSKTSIYEFDHETILLKGARAFQFEKVERFLEKQIHHTHLEIDLNALAHNLTYFKSLLKDKTKVMAMVKAFSYGSGGHEIARFLEFSGIDYLAVAYADEGVELRKDGIRKPIMVMNPDIQAFSVILDNELEPEIYSLEILRDLISVMDSKGIVRAKIHIELNTGMNRLGFDVSELRILKDELLENPQIEVTSIFSHLTSSDMPDQDEDTKRQLEVFDQMYGALSDAIGYKPLKHILNSSGIIRFPEGQYDMVRLGIGLYGIDPSGSGQDQLLSIGTLKSIISQIRIVKAGKTIGYGRLSPVEHDRKIAVVAIGYADGLNRLLSEGKGYFSIKGHRAPIVGNICMDMTMCDVSHIKCKPGDEVIVFGEDPSIQDLAEKLNTIPYEILTSVSSRVKRVYTRE